MVADEIGEPLEREIFAVQRNQHGIGGHQRVQRQQAERRGAVDEDVVVAVAHAAHERAEALFALRQRDELDLGAGQVAVGGHEIKALDAGLNDERAGVGRAAPG